MVLQSLLNLLVIKIAFFMSKDGSFDVWESLQLQAREHNKNGELYSCGNKHKVDERVNPTDM